MEGHVISGYQELEQIAEVWNGDVCLFGAGLIGRTWGYDVIKQAGFHIDYYCDNHVSSGQVIRDNIRCIAFNDLLDKEVLVFITVAGWKNTDIIDQLLERGINKIVVVDYFFMQKMIESIWASGDNLIKEKYKCIFDDEEYLKNLFFYKMGYLLNLESPKTFNEKIQWLKLYNRKREYIRMVDKYAVRDYVKDILGEKYLIPLVGGPYYGVDEIDWNCLPDQFVLKCNHDSGSVIICKDKSEFDFVTAKKKLAYALKSNFWLGGREWPYRDVKPCIIAEKYMEDESKRELKDYKIHNFDGEPYIIQVDFDRFKEHKRNIYNTDWQYIEASIKYPTDNAVLIKRPACLEEMLELSKVLSKNIPYVRIDFYSVGESIYFGEITFFHGGGYEKFKPEKLEYELGKKINIFSSVKIDG